MKYTLCLVALSLATLTGCGKAKDKDQVTDAEKTYYATVIQTAYRPYISAMSEVAACQWVFGSSNPDSDIQSSLLQELAARLGENARRIRQMKADDVSIETRGLAEEIAAQEALFSLSVSKIKQPDAGAELVGWLADMIALDKHNLDAQQTEELRIKMGMQRLGNYVNGTIQAKAHEVEASAGLERTVQEMKTRIEAHRIAIGGIKAAQLINPEEVVRQIITEQFTRAQKAQSRINSRLLSKTLTGKQAAGWTFESGEIKAVRIISSEVRGHCVLNEAEIDVVGVLAGAKTLHVRMAHQVLADGSIVFLAINGIE